MRHAAALVILFGLLLPAAARAAVPPFRVEVRGKGPPVLLLPGLTCGARVWDDLAAELCRDHECHLFTLAGFAGEPAIGAPFLPRVRDALVAYVRDRRLVRPAVIGHSLGAFLALWISATAPERFGPVVALDGLPFLPAAMDPAATAVSMRPQAEAMRAQLGKQAQAAFAAQTRATLATMIRRPEDVARVARDAERSSPAAVGEAYFELLTTDLRPLLSRIESPVLLVAAAAFAPDEAARTVVRDTYEAQVARIRRHEVVVAPGARHFVMLDEPAFTRAQIARHLAAGAL